MLKDSEARRPLPPALRQRLRDIPRHEVLCRNTDRLYRAARDRAARDRAEDRAALTHLDECPRCQAVYGTLACAFAERRLPLPRRLVRDLCSIVRHPRRLLPVWIADTRYAAAACYLLATLTLSLASDAAVLFTDASVTVGSKARVWAETGEARGVEAWGAATAAVDRGVDDGWGRVTRAGASCQKFFAGTFKAIETTTNELIPGRDRPVEGGQNERTTSDGRPAGGGD